MSPRRGPPRLGRWLLRTIVVLVLLFLLAPALIVHGELDRFVPVQYVDDFLRLLPNATSEIIPGVGHMLLTEALDQVLEAMSRVRSNA